MIATVLSDLLKKNGISDKYQVTQTDVSDLIGSAVYSLEHGYPVVVNVKEMPNYVVSSGHFIVIHGYYGCNTSRGKNFVRLA